MKIKCIKMKFKLDELEVNDFVIEAVIYGIFCDFVNVYLSKLPLLFKGKRYLSGRYWKLYSFDDT